MTGSRLDLLPMKNTSRKGCRENKNTHFIFSNFFRESCRLRDNVEKFPRARKVINGKMAHAHCMLDN